MAHAPILETSRLSLVPFSEEHLNDRYIGWLNDPEVVRFSELRHTSHNIDSCRAYFESFAESPHYYFAIMAHDSAIGHIGNITAHVDLANQVADIGILLGEKRIWGSGYGSEAWTAVCDFLLNTAGLRKITAGTMASNRGMLGVMKSAGMFEEGRRIRQYLRDGRPEDLCLFALFGLTGNIAPPKPH